MFLKRNCKTQQLSQATVQGQGAGRTEEPESFASRDDSGIQVLTLSCFLCMIKTGSKEVEENQFLFKEAV